MNQEDIYSEDRIEEFIQLVEKFGDIPTTRYFSLNRAKILEEIQKEKYRLEYPIAYNLITNDKKNQILSFEEKAIELFKYVNKTRRMINLNDKVQFSNEDFMYFFWNDKKKQIINYFIESNYKDIFPIFYNLIISYFFENRIKIYSNLHRFFGYVDLDNCISIERDISTEQSMVDYWKLNKELLYFISMSTMYKERYPLACKIIINQYVNEINENIGKVRIKRMGE